MSFPISEHCAIEHSAALPAQADAVVIGGGIIGVMTAWELAKAGLKPVLLEKGRIAGEQSSRNWGWVRAQGRDAAEIPIMLEAQEIWHRLSGEVKELHLTRAGSLYLAARDADMDKYQDWLDQVAGYQLSSRLLSAYEVADEIPAASARWAGALHTPTDLRAEPFTAVPALARAAVKAGVTIIENCAVRMLDIEAGAVTGVITEQGRIASKAVALAGGAWSSLLLRRHGVALPQLSVRSSVAATHDLPDICTANAVDHELAWRRRKDGGYTLAPGGSHDIFIGPDVLRAMPYYFKHLLGDLSNTRYLSAAPKHYPDAWSTKRRWQDDEVSPFEKMRVLDPQPDKRKIAKLARDFAARFPELGEVKLKSAWAGMIDILPDVVPVVDHGSALPNLMLCTGMCGHGFGIGPAFGRICADLMQGRDAGHDLSRFRFGRFSDGSKLTMGPSL